MPSYESYDNDHSAADEGTAAHWFASESLHNVITGLLPLPVGSVSPTGHVLDDEMQGALKHYYDEILATTRRYHVSGGEYIGIEKTITCGAIHPTCFGTPDFWCFDPSTRTLYIADYKHGRVPVEVWDNWQLIIYASGLAHMLGGITKLELVIVQPRAFHHRGTVRRWITDYETIYPKTLEANKSALVALSDTPHCTPGRHCRRCPGRRGCRANQNFMAALCDVSTSPVPRDLTPDQAAVEWVFLKRAIKLLESRFDAIESLVKASASRGESMPAVHVSLGKGRQFWVKSLEEVKALATIYGAEVSKETLLTPLQAIKAGLPDSLVNDEQFTSRGKSSLKITEASSSDAALTFGEQ